MGTRLLILSMILCLFSSWGWAQQGDQPKDEPRRREPQRQQRRTPQYQRPVFLSGKVMMEDGEAPPESVQVELICQGTVVQQVYTSGNGTFSLQINPGQGAQSALMPMDASVSSASHGPLAGGFSGNYTGSNSLGDNPGFGRTQSLNLSACDLHAKLVGFESERIILGPRRVLDNPDVGVIVLHPRARAESATISLKTLAAPKDAKKAYEKAVKELGKQEVNFSKATKELEKAVQIYPEFAAAWHLMGEISLELENPQSARKSFQEAVAADSLYAAPYTSLARLELEEEHWEEAAQLSRQALDLDPQLVRAHYFNALANSSLGKLDAAEASVLQVQRSSKAQEYPLAHYVLGWIMSQKGDFDFAAAEFRRFLEIAPTAPLAEQLQEQLAQWEDLGLISNSDTPDPQN